MQTCADWLRCYSNLDVAPGLEALEKIRAFYTDKGIDILKDAVSLLGVSLHYLFRVTTERGAELYSPCKEAYGMLKEAVVGGRSLVFKGYHEAGVTKIRPHRFANALYLSTMLRDMPCGKERVIHYQNPVGETPLFTERLNAGTWFGFAEVDMEIFPVIALVSGT